VGAVLLAVPGAVAVQASPPRIRLTDPLTAYWASEAGQVNHWWADDPRQRFWLEVTDRPDIGWTCTARSEMPSAAATLDIP
jgi:hypothetical protein